MRPSRFALSFGAGPMPIKCNRRDGRNTSFSLIHYFPLHSSHISGSEHARYCCPYGSIAPEANSSGNRHHGRWHR